MTLRTGYRADIDGLRAVAVLGVLFFHAGLGFPGGYIGVDVFFVISGYLITRLIVSDLERGVFTFKNFWGRRLRRIWPAATCMVVATLGVGYFLLAPRPYHELATDAIPQSLMMANIQFMRGADYFGQRAELRPLLHTWSLAVEEQFYLFHPFLVVLVWKFRPRALLPCLLVLSVLSLALSAVTLGPMPMATFYLLPTRAWELLVGAALAVAPATAVLEPSGRAARLGRAFMGPAGLALTLAPMFFYGSDTPFPGLAALPPCLGTALLIRAGSQGHSPVSRVLAWEPLRRIGLISYSLYLVHWPILAFMRSLSWPSEPALAYRLCVIPVSIVLAWLSWRFIEQRFRHTRAPHAPGAPRAFGRTVGASLAATAFVVGVSLFIRATDGWRGRFSDAMLAYIDSPRVNAAWRSEEVESSDILDLTMPMGDPADPRPRFVLWGDSHAMAISEVIDEEAMAAGVAGVARLRSATTPVPALWSPAATPAAAKANQRVLDWIIQERVPHVILCARWSVETDGRTDGLVSRRLDTLVTPVGSPRHTDPARAQEALADALGRLVRTLEDAGVTVWILRDVPYQWSTPELRAIKARLTGADIPQTGVTAEAHRRHVVNADKAVSRAATPCTRVLDLADACFDESGRSMIANARGVSYYMDDDHFNTVGTRTLLLPLIHGMMREIAADRQPPANPVVPDGNPG